ncbi:MAG: outer membrane beta-barrel protein [Acidobacteria bacterium]|nr:outer membrane beta-barrel protein [Acidobacteriota bacterium]
MKGVTWLSILGLLLAIPSALRAQEGGEAYNHGSVGIFVDYLRFSPGPTTTNFVGLGGRAGFHMSHSVQLEGEVNYDFQRNVTNTFSNGISTSFVTTRVRPLTGLFGPKFQTPGPFKFFVTAKVGFINFSTTTSAVTFGTLGTAFSSVGGAGTHFAVYPGGGLEGFWGPFGLRAEVGDTIYLNNGTFNNLRVTFGPQLRF